jgi:hypothetical protein
VSDKRNHDEEEKIAIRLAPELSDDLDLLVKHLELAGARRHGAVTRARAVRHAIAERAAQVRGQQGQAGG